MVSVESHSSVFEITPLGLQAMNNDKGLFLMNRIVCSVGESFLLLNAAAASLVLGRAIKFPKAFSLGI